MYTCSIYINIREPEGQPRMDNLQKYEQLICTMFSDYPSVLCLGILKD